MDIRNSKEIIQNILDRYNFTAVYSDSCNKFGLETSQNYCDSIDAVDFLYSSAVIGSKALGIFTELPFFEITKPLRAECLFITHTLPKRISTPVIIVKNAADISDRLTLALKISVEHKIPVTVVITHNASNNYTDFERANNDLGRISPFISASTFKQNISSEELLETYKAVYNMLIQSFPDDNTSPAIISLQNKGFFPDFFVPEIISEKLKEWKHSYDKNTLKIEVYKSEKALLENFLFNNYNIEISFPEIEDKVFPEISNLLCPGCPFVNIFARGVEKDTIIFTDITCKGVLKAFPELNYISIDGYMGIISSEIRPATLFIGSASSYKTHYNKFINKRGRVILLNDSGISKIDGFSSIRHPKKLGKTKNILYPYSCNNIRHYSKVKVKLKKCNCMQHNEKCNVFQKTLCPAIYLSSNNILVDSSICNGCLACKVLCSQGAIS